MMCLFSPWVLDCAGSGSSTGKSTCNPDISAWDVSAATDMSYMFYDANAFDRDIGSWDVSGVTTMQSMFGGAYAFDQDISAWDVSGVNTMTRMFYDATSFSHTLCSDAWRDSKSNADQTSMFTGTNGGIC